MVVLTSFSFARNFRAERWTKNEKAQYSTLKELANYVYKKEKSEISKDSLFEHYIYFDFVLKDTVAERKESRIEAFDTLFYYFRNVVDSIGFEKLDAKPVRFYKKHVIYEPFAEVKSKHKGDDKINANDENVFAYYKKEDPANPLGVLLFEPKTNKLVAWIMISQGGYKYFLTFNLF